MTRLAGELSRVPSSTKMTHEGAIASEMPVPHSRAAVTMRNDFMESFDPERGRVGALSSRNGSRRGTCRYQGCNRAASSAGSGSNSRHCTGTSRHADLLRRARSPGRGLQVPSGCPPGPARPVPCRGRADTSPRTTPRHCRHVVQAGAVGREGLHGCRPLETIACVVPGGKLALPDVGLGPIERERLVPPDIRLAVDTTASGEFPLRLRGQALADPAGVCHGVVPGDVDDGMIALTYELATRPLGMPRARGAPATRQASPGPSRRPS